MTYEWFNESNRFSSMMSNIVWFMTFLTGIGLLFYGTYNLPSIMGIVWIGIGFFIFVLMGNVSDSETYKIIDLLEKIDSKLEKKKK